MGTNPRVNAPESDATPGQGGRGGDLATAPDDLGTEKMPREAPPYPRAEADMSASAKLRKAQVRAALFRKVEPTRVGRFVLLEQLGAGGMGEIYAAYDDQLDRKVALKLVRSDSRGGAKADERLLREAQALAQVSHPNVVQIYETGTYSGKVFIAMELVRGKTLTSWLRDAGQLPRGLRTRQILRQFIAAGRGLEAAHAAGVTHRDFKPDNVLVGDDGRVRVVDFGLARALIEEAAAESGAKPAPGAEPDTLALSETVSGDGSSGAPFATDGATIDYKGTPADAARSAPKVRPGRARTGDPAPEVPKLKAAVRLTETGTVMGTPRFMAPEQMRGKVADHRSDQFSFCVSLYQALYDEFPFAGESWQELKASMESGEVRAAPQLPTPSFVRKALRRGLSVEPAQRFASMGELLAALEPRTRRASSWVAAVGLSAAALGAVYVRSQEAEDPCAAAGAAIDAPWSAERQAGLQAVFGRSEQPFAQVTWSGLKARVDDYTGRWRGEAIAACRATHVEHTQSAQQLDKRMSCLDRGKRQLAALVTELSASGPGAVAHAIKAAEALPGLETCGDANSLLFGLAPPPAAVAGQVAAVRDRIARAFTLELLAQPAESLLVAREAGEAARGLGYPPVHAEALAQMGRALSARGTTDARGEAEQLYFQALDIAEAERHDELAAGVWHLLVYLAVGSDRERAHAWWRRNEAAVRRLGGNTFEQAKLHHLRGEIYYRQGKYREAVAEQRRAIAAIEPMPAHRVELSRYYDALAKSLEHLGQLDEALGLHERALAVAAETYGAGHLDVLQLQANFAKVLEKRGQLDRARSVLESALASMSAQDRTSHPRAAKLHTFLSDVEYKAGRLGRAAEHGRASVDIHGRARSPEPELADSIAALANVELRRRSFKDALALYERVLELRRRHLPEDHYQLGWIEGTIAETLVELERHADALAHVLAAERIFDRNEGRRRESLPWILTVHGEALVGLRRHGEALAVLEQALGLFGDGASDPTNHGLALWTLARALHELGRDGARVRALAEQARATFAKQGAIDAHFHDAVARFLDRLPARTPAPPPSK